jgi:replicative DNA helicase
LTTSDGLSDQDLERSLLAALLVDNRGFDQLGSLQPDHLSNPLHAAVLAAAVDLRAENRAVSLVTLRSRFASVPFADHCSVLDHLKRFEFAGTAADVGDMAAALRELAQRREIRGLGERIAGSVHDRAVGPATLLTDAARSVDDLLAGCRPAGKTLWTMPDAVADLLAPAGEGDECIATGLTDLDRYLGGGLRCGNSVILGGRPSMGKSTVAVALARRVAKGGHGVLLFSMEMRQRDCMLRMATDACWRRDMPVAYANVAAGKLNEQERRTYELGAKSLADLPIMIEERTGLTMSEIASQTRRVAELFARLGKGLDLVIVDHLDHMTPSNRYRGNKVQEVGEYSVGMQRLAKSEQVAVLTLHQLNRNPEGRDNKRPELSDLRDSGRLEQDADIVLFAYRAAYYLERMKFDDPDDERERIGKLDAKRYELELNIAKQRNGPTCAVELFCDMACNAIRDKWSGS